jgi:hypothetical protein
MMTLLIFLTIAIIAILLALFREQRAFVTQVQGLKEKLNELVDKSDRIQAVVLEIEERTAPPLEQASRQFERGQPLSTGILRHLSPGDEIKLIEKSHHYPFGDPFLFIFGFELESTSEGSDASMTVYGRRRVAHTEPWTKYEFTVSPNGATTQDGSGDIRGILQPGMDDPLITALEAN